MVFKRIRDSPFAAASTWTFGTTVFYVIQDHPVYIPCGQRWPLRPELAAPLGVWSSSQLPRCAGGRAGWRLSGDVAVLSCCTVSASSAHALGAVLTRRPSAFQAGHIPSWQKSCECYALSPVAGAYRWLLLLLSPLLSRWSETLCDASSTTARDGLHLAALVLITTCELSSAHRAGLCPAQPPPPNPTAAGPGDGWVLSSSASRVHEPCTPTWAVALRPQPGLTGSGSHRYSYGGFGGGHPHFHRHTGCQHPNLTSHPVRLRLMPVLLPTFVVPIWKDLDHD